MIIERKDGVTLRDTTMTSPVYLDVTKPPFSIHGFSEPFRRVPKNIADATSKCVSHLSEVSAGGRIRFRATSEYVAIHAELGEVSVPANSSIVAALSFDIYMVENGKHYFRGMFIPSQGEGKTYVESRLKYHDNMMKDIVLYCPLAAQIKELYIGLSEGSEILDATPYTHQKPVVIYGSSIVHGGGLRPSSPYTAVLSRRLDTEFVNLGFGGGALAEKEILDYIAGLEMSVFIYDYDHNAPSLEYLEKTHYAGYRLFRERQPSTPVIMASKPDYWSRNYSIGEFEKNENELRRKLIEENYHRAIAEGDRNVYFVDGSKMFPAEFREDCTSDGCHPNDLGYHYMANAFENVLKGLLK